MDKNEIKNNITEMVCQYDYIPMIPKQMFEYLDLTDSDRENFNGALTELSENYDIAFTTKGKICLPEAIGVFTGQLSCTERGFGFLVNKEKLDDDIFIPANRMNGAMHRDLVAVRRTKKSNKSHRAEGEVIKVIKRNSNAYVGTFRKSRNFGFVVLDDRKIKGDIFVSNKDSLNAKDDDKVIVELLTLPGEKPGGKSLEGRITEIIGSKNDKGVDVLSVLRSYGFKRDFEAGLLSEADRIPQSLTEKDIKGRKDLRNELIFTIDGDDTKDIDDAVSIDVLDNGLFRLGVHIADVSYYVKEDSKLDKEAYERGTSVYLVNTVTPMLPKQLSNGICSLNPGVDRLALSVTMDINTQGEVIAHDIYKSVIRSREQMTYNNVYKIIEQNDNELIDRYKDISEKLFIMKRLALILKEKRHRRGAVDFDFPEAKIIVDENGEATDIVKREITIANGIIEEFMLACNETVAEHFFWMASPFLYRIHEEPDVNKVMDFADFLRVMGYKLKGVSKVHPRTFQELTEKVKGKKEERIINTLMLRSMQKARYSDVRNMHFGLAAEYYCHFTSPIRRYPDLEIHRIISDIIQGKMTEKKDIHYRDILTDYALHCSERERAAEEAEREADKMKMCEFMKKHINEEFTGIISGVANFGMFVELDNLVEGVVRMTNLNDDYYIYDEKNYMLIGERTKKMYKIGDSIKVIVIDADINNKSIEFIPSLIYNSF